VKSEVMRINMRFANDVWQPIILLDAHHQRHEVNALYRAADVCLVSSLQDGMNLVSKEFIAAREDEKGVLVLSQFAGARDELKAALIVNPHNIAQVAQALHRALTMPPDEVQWRMRALRRTVEMNCVHRWAASIFTDAAISRAERSDAEPNQLEHHADGAARRFVRTHWPSVNPLADPARAT
jgi:trehalose-6-phosphate synthase